MRLGVLSQPHHPALHDILDRLRNSAEKIGAELVLTADLLAESGGEAPVLKAEPMTDIYLKSDLYETSKPESWLFSRS